MEKGIGGGEVNGDKKKRQKENNSINYFKLILSFPSL